MWICKLCFEDLPARYMVTQSPQDLLFNFGLEGYYRSDELVHNRLFVTIIDAEQKEVGYIKAIKTDLDKYVWF